MGSFPSTLRREQKAGNRKPSIEDEEARGENGKAQERASMGSTHGKETGDTAGRGETKGTQQKVK